MQKPPSFFKMIQTVLKKIEPSDIEESLIASLANKLHEIANELGHDAVVCGSIGKLTWLSGDHDIDLFVFFDKTVSREELEKRGLDIGKKMASVLRGATTVRYAEHPYTRVRAKFSSEYFDIDIVPCYKIMRGEKIISAVDRSPLHLSYILKNLKPNQRNEVRLLKQFMKGVGVYGSDAKNLGFSGYICELLIVRYGKFENVLKAAADWNVPQIIEIEKSAVAERKKFTESLIIIDPTDAARNAAAVVSAENFARSVAYAKRFLAKPGIEYFFPKEITMKNQEITQLKRRGTKFFALVMKKPDIIDDIIYPQLRRTVSRVNSLLRQNEFFTVRKYEFADDENIILIFEMETWMLPLIKKMVGPPVFSRKHTKEFLDKYKGAAVMYGPYVEDDRWVAEKKRDFITVAELMKNFIGRSFNEHLSSGIPKNIANEFGRAKILEHDEFWKLVGKKKELSSFLRKKYFDAP